MLTHHYKSTVGQNGGRYSKFGVTEIPTDIPPDVVEVDIYSNKITTFEANTFSQLSLCTHLLLGPSISEIEPGAFNGLTALTELTLNFNRLERLSVNMFSGINNCKMLYLAQNKISEIEPGSFDGLDNLERLDLNENHLTTLRTDMFLGLSKCAEIRLVHNLISEIESGSFNGLFALRILQIYDNRLERLYMNMFSALTNCTQLLLWSNQIRVIEPGSFNRLSLEDLYLNHNSLTTLKTGTFQGLLSAISLTLSNNNISSIEENAFIGLKHLRTCGLLTINLRH